jgi:flagellar hook-length control protein FliK
MMASIPNTRSTPLPLPTATTPAAGEAAPGDFTIRLPATPPPGRAPVATLPMQPPTPEEIIEGLVPAAVGAAEQDGDGDQDTAPQAKAETPAKDGEPEAAILIPVVQPLPAVQHPPVVAGPQVAPTISATEAPPAEAAASPVQAAPLPCAPSGKGKKALPDPATADPAKDEADATEIESAVKELLSRKQVLAKQADATPAKTAKTDTAAPDAPAPAQAQARTHGQSAARAPAAAVQAPTALPTTELPQPVLAALDAQPAPAKAEKTGTIDGARSTDLATERKLDLARDTEWLDRLARDIARAGSNDTPLRFRLHPQTLGSLHVELQQGDHGTAVRLTVETEAARQILADAQPRLTAEARAQGVRIAETHVDLSGSGRHAPGDQRRQDEARQNPLISTASGAGTDAGARPRAAARARLDRYA